MENKSQSSSQKDSSKNYTIEKFIASGTFGSVYVAVDNTTQEKVAIKKVFQDRRYKNREHKIISDLNHPNIVKLNSAFYTRGEKQDDVYLNLVMEYVPQTLSKEIRENKKQGKCFSPIQVKIYAYQMMRALAYQQSLGLAHRDIKPQNILIDTKTNVLKICDFGSAKILVKGQENIAYICSRYYRSPELIFGNTEYTTIIDSWSIGCVLVEMITGEPIFPGQSAVDQLIEIIKVLGTPTAEQVMELNPKHQEYKFPVIKTLSWKKILGKYKVDPLLIDLIQQVLVYSPTKRLQPLQCLSHPYFDELRDANFYKLNKNITIPNLFDWTNEEKYLGRNIIQQLTPSWVKNMQKGQVQQQQQPQQQQQGPPTHSRSNRPPVDKLLQNSNLNTNINNVSNNKK